MPDPTDLPDTSTDTSEDDTGYEDPNDPYDIMGLAHHFSMSLKVALKTAMMKFQINLTKIFSNQANELHALGDMHSSYITGETPDIGAVTKRANDFAKDYEKELVEKGGTTINGKFVPWLNDRVESERQEIAKIITDGIKNGDTTDQIGEALSKHFDGYRNQAKAIAHHEGGTIISKGQLSGWDASGHTAVDVLDDEGPNSCQECSDVNGEVWSIDYANDHAKEHPWCVRSFSPKDPNEEWSLDEE